MRLTQIVPIESYTVPGLYTDSFHGNYVFDGRMDMHFITQYVLFIIRSIFETPTELINHYSQALYYYIRVNETYTNSS